MTLISGTDALREFRKSFTGEQVLNLLSEGEGRLLVNLPIGAGKTWNLDQVVKSALRQDLYGLVIALFPLRQLIRDRPWILKPPRGLGIVDLKPRPRKSCGKERDRLWRQFERASLTLLGRREICGNCPKRKACYWPRQYGKGLVGTRLIFGTQTHLERDPGFVARLKLWTQAERVLLLLDEINFVMRPFSQRIRREDLIRFHSVLLNLRRTLPCVRHTRWIYLCGLLLEAETPDLRAPEWRMPRLEPSWIFRVQEQGYKQFGEKFRFLGFMLDQLGRSEIDTRQKTSNGDVIFSNRAEVPCDFIIYSGTAHPEFTSYRLGQGFSNPFAELRFTHPDTIWYNIASRLGTRRHFPANRKQILHFFARLIAKRLHGGRRVLLVSKKCFRETCAEELSERLIRAGHREIEIIYEGFDTIDLSNPHVIPLINYGLVGVNLFEHFDCAYCLMGYYINEPVLNAVLQDILATDFEIPLKIQTGGVPRRRTVEVLHPDHRFYDIQELAPMALQQQEMDVVLQAVGRVRPYTRAREIITFQCAAHPQLGYTEEFDSITEARRYFDIPSAESLRQAHTTAEIQAARNKGWTQQTTAENLGMSLRTVKRYWNTKKVT